MNLFGRKPEPEAPAPPPPVLPIEFQYNIPEDGSAAACVMILFPNTNQYIRMRLVDAESLHATLGAFLKRIHARSEKEP